MEEISQKLRKLCISHTNMQDYTAKLYIHRHCVYAFFLAKHNTVMNLQYWS